MKRSIFSLFLAFAAVIMTQAQSVESKYVEDFDGSHYDGTSYLPVGWTTSGDQPFYTMSWYTLPAHSGKFYAISIDINYYQTSIARNDEMYTCMFNLEGGVKYSGSYWLHNDADGPSKVTFSVGSSQEAENQEVLHTKSTATAGDWEEMTFEFTPEKSGSYCFGWHVTSGNWRTTFVAIDDFSIIQAWMADLPQADFALTHIYDISTGGLVTYPGQAIKIDNITKKATSYLWECSSSDVSFSDATAEEPTVTFAKAGRYTIILNATNDSGTSQKKLTIDVRMGNEMGYYGVTTYDGNKDELIQRGTVPTFKTDLDYDYITGPNHLYREFAERYAFSDDYPVQLNTINVFLTEYSLRTDMWQTQQNVPLEVIVYGETDGKIDESKVFGTSTATIGQTFGTTGVGGTSAEPRNITLNEPIVVKGPAYISFRVGEDFSINDDGAQIIRSYFCLAPIRKPKTSTMIVKPYYLPSGIANKTLVLGDWCTPADIDADLPAAVGMYNIVWVSPFVGDGINDVNAENSLPTPLHNDAIYNLAGQRISSTDGMKGIMIRGGKKFIVK